MKKFKIKKGWVLLIVFSSTILQFLLLSLINYFFTVDSNDTSFWVFLLFGTLLLILIGLNELSVEIIIDDKSVKRKSLVALRVINYCEIVNIKEQKFLKLFKFYDTGKYPLVVGGFIKEYKEVISLIKKNLKQLD